MRQEPIRHLKAVSAEAQLSFWICLHRSPELKPLAYFHRRAPFSQNRKASDASPAPVLTDNDPMP